MWTPDARHIDTGRHSNHFHQLALLSCRREPSEIPQGLRRPDGSENIFSFICAHRVSLFDPRAPNVELECSNGKNMDQSRSGEAALRRH